MRNAVVSTRHVTITAKDGSRLKAAKWGKRKVWKVHKNTANNLTAAIDFVHKALEKQHMGTIVYVGTIPVYHAKYNRSKKQNLDMLFKGWKSNPVANYWKSKLSS